MVYPCRVVSSAQPPARRSYRQPWIGVGLATLLLVVTASVVVIELDQGPRPPFLVDGEAPAKPRYESSDVLRLAGSGSNLPVTRALAAAHAVRSDRPLVHASIGSAGGIAALLDGAIDLALVSRPLTEQERARGLVAHPYALLPAVVAVHGSVPERAITKDELLAIYRGDETQWSDGTPIEVLMREEGDSSHRAVAEVIPEFAEANAAAYREGRWRVLYHDAAMLEAIETTQGAIGLHGSGIGPGLHGYEVMAVDGVFPGPETVQAGEYPFVKTLSFVTLGEPDPRSAAFIELARSALGRGIIRQYGGYPLRDGQEPS